MKLYNDKILCRSKRAMYFSCVAHGLRIFYCAVKSRQSQLSHEPPITEEVAPRETVSCCAAVKNYFPRRNKYAKQKEDHICYLSAYHSAERMERRAVHRKRG